MPGGHPTRAEGTGAKEEKVSGGGVDTEPQEQQREADLLGARPP